MNYHIKNMRLFLYFSALFFGVLSCQPKPERSRERSQPTTLQVDQVKPPHWWVGFESEDLQLLVKSEHIQGMNVSVDAPGIQVVKVHNADSPNYLFIDLKIRKNATCLESLSYCFHQMIVYIIN